MEILKPFRDENNGDILSINVPATLVKLPSAEGNWMENSNGKQYAVAISEITYPNGTTKNARSIIYRNQLETGLFNEGDEIMLRTQLEGEYKGNSVVQLAATDVVDIDALDLDLSEFAEAAADVEAEA